MRTAAGDPPVADLDRLFTQRGWPPRAASSPSAKGRVSRASPVQTALRNCTRDEGGPFGFGDQELIPSHRKLLW
ncbi:MAG: hypothetical protein V3R24_07230, partial [Gemmatimonadales bacterium]